MNSRHDGRREEKRRRRREEEEKKSQRGAGGTTEEAMILWGCKLSRSIESCSCNGNNHGGLELVSASVYYSMQPTTKCLCSRTPRFATRASGGEIARRELKQEKKQDRAMFHENSAIASHLICRMPQTATADPRGKPEPPQ